MSGARFGPVGRPPESHPRCGPGACVPGLRSRPAAPKWAAGRDRNRRPIRSEACSKPPSRWTREQRPCCLECGRKMKLVRASQSRKASWATAVPGPRRGPSSRSTRCWRRGRSPCWASWPASGPGGRRAAVLLAGFHVSGCRRALPSVTGALGGEGRLAQPWRTSGRQRRLSSGGMALRASAAAARTAGGRGSSARAGRRIPSSVAAGGNAPTNVR